MADHPLTPTFTAPADTVAHSPLIDAAMLRQRLMAAADADPEAAPLVLDVSFDLARPDAGRAAWQAGHIPGAIYADLERDLSAVKTGRNGRHPLPLRNDFARTVAAWGLVPGRDVVVYDRQGAMFAARLWWMLRWLGHTQVRVLDGGWAAWCAAGGAVACASDGAPRVAPTAAAYPLSAVPGMPVRTVDEVLADLGRITLIDARAPERFRGDVEPLDAVAGHIPGAANRPFQHNLGPDGRFLAPETLRAAFAAWAQAPLPVVHQCGSGVTACHNLLAMAAAGLPTTTLYAGSWSEWSSDPQRPVARG